LNEQSGFIPAFPGRFGGETGRIAPLYAAKAGSRKIKHKLYTPALDMKWEDIL
jgi:hypothetical protein